LYYTLIQETASLLLLPSFTSPILFSFLCSHECLQTDQTGSNLFYSVENKSQRRKGLYSNVVPKNQKVMLGPPTDPKTIHPNYLSGAFFPPSVNIPCPFLAKIKKKMTRTHTQTLIPFVAFLTFFFPPTCQFVTATPH
jgi:hypothetical protein